MLISWYSLHYWMLFSELKIHMCFFLEVLPPEELYSIDTVKLIEEEHSHVYTETVLRHLT